MKTTRKKLRVAVLGSRGIPDVMGGIETHCTNLYPRLVAKGHRITILARKGYVAPKPFMHQGVSVEPLWTPKRKCLEAIFHTAYGVMVICFRRREFDLLHIHGIGPSLLVPLARFCGLKVIITHHGPDYERLKWGWLAKSMIRLGERLGCRFADGVITVSRHIRTTIKSLYNCDGHYVPNGVTIPEHIDAGDMLRTHDLSAGRYLLAVGRFVPEKGFHDLLEAYRSVESDWRLVIAGASDHEDNYSKGLRQLGAKDSRVVFTGFIKGRELGEIFSNAGLFVMPSYHEGLPIALLEAMSYNLPFVSTDIPANMELASPSQVYRVGDVGQLKEYLQTFLSSPVSALNNQSRIESEFNWDVVANRTEEIYSLVV